jgi:hypothetical protein
VVHCGSNQALLLVVAASRHTDSELLLLLLLSCVVWCCVGTIPRVDPSEELPEVDQDPPESVAAGPTPGYSPRGGDQRPI